MNKSRLVLGVIGVLLLGGCIYYFSSYRYSNSEWKLHENTNLENTSVKNEIINKNEVTSATKNIIKTYSSEKLGVEFDYALRDPLFTDVDKDNIVVEKDSTITTEPGGGMIKVFKKDPKITFESTIKAIFPDCKVVVSNNTNKKYRSYNSYMNMSARIYVKDSHLIGQENVPPTSDFEIGQAGDVVQTKENLKCFDEVEKFDHLGYDYLTDSDSSDKFIAIEGMAQAPEGVLRMDGNTVVTWMSTVRFIK